MRINSILAPTDFSETANHAVDQAFEMAVRTQATLHLFHVRETHDADPGAPSSTVRDFMKRLEDAGESSLALKVDTLRGNKVDVFYETENGTSVFESIAAKVEQRKPDLVVMGTHGRAGLGRLLIGSVAEKVLRHVPVDVMTVSRNAPVVPASHAFERVLVPVDFSEFSKRAVAAGAELAVPDGDLFVAHVVASPLNPSFYPSGGSSLFQLDPAIPKRIRERLDEWLEEQTVAEIFVREGAVFVELESICNQVDAQLMVMGTRGLSGLDRLLVGSVTEKMVRSSGIPVLTVH